MKKNYVKPAVKSYDMAPVSIMEGSAIEEMKRKRKESKSFFDDEPSNTNDYWKK